MNLYPYECRLKNSQHDINKPNSAIYKKITQHDQMRFIPGMQG